MSANVKPSVFNFLNNLNNNNREWFVDNIDYYLKLEGQIKEFFTAIYESLSTIDNIGGESL